VARFWTGNGSGTWIFPKPGQEYYVCVTVKNNGTASAFGATLSFKILFEDHPQQILHCTDVGLGDDRVYRAYRA
jgi:hypothetical protein